MQRMTLIARGFPIVVEPHTMYNNQARVYYGPLELGRLTDNTRTGIAEIECLFDSSRGIIAAYGNIEQRVATACDRMVAHLQNMASCRYLPPTLETVGDEDED